MNPLETAELQFPAFLALSHTIGAAGGCDPPPYGEFSPLLSINLYA